jgi:phosphatidylethanolamine-binding protein (PEBP) family uncharacterized protein
MKIRNALRRLGRRTGDGQTRNLDAAAGYRGPMPPDYVHSYDEGRPKH